MTSLRPFLRISLYVFLCVSHEGFCPQGVFSIVLRCKAIFMEEAWPLLDFSTFVQFFFKNWNDWIKSILNCFIVLIWCIFCLSLSAFTCKFVENDENHQHLALRRNVLPNFWTKAGPLPDLYRFDIFSFCIFFYDVRTL